MGVLGYKVAPLVHILPAKNKTREFKPYYFTTYLKGAPPVHPPSTYPPGALFNLKIDARI